MKRLKVKRLGVIVTHGLIDVPDNINSLEEALVYARTHPDEIIETREIRIPEKETVTEVEFIERK